MKDLIDRQAAIDALTEYGNGRAVYISAEEAFRRIEQLPSAQPSFPQRHENDCINRQDAIDEIGRFIGYIDEDMIERIRIGLKRLPSARPETSIPLLWIEKEIEWLKSLDDGFSTLTAMQISAMVKKWKEGEADG